MGPLRILMGRGTDRAQKAWKSRDGSVLRPLAVFMGQGPAPDGRRKFLRVEDAGGTGKIKRRPWGRAVVYGKGGIFMLSEQRKNEEKELEKRELFWLPGMTSVTFRGKKPEEVIALAKEARLLGIEWGGDIHVPPEDLEEARRVGRMTREEGLLVLSYGSYYHLGRGEPVEPVLEAARELGAPNVRIWAGDFTPDAAPEAYWEKAVSELQEICRKAEALGLTVSTEYHRGTLTQTREGALRLMRGAGCRNLFTYWQPNPDISHEKNLLELEGVRSHLSSIHVFQWKRKDVRYPLEEGLQEWESYLRKGPGVPWGACILEFVKDDSPEQFLKDARCLHGILRRLGLHTEKTRKTE